MHWLIIIHVSKGSTGTVYITAHFTPDKRQSKTIIQSTNVDQKSLETVFDCHFPPDWRHMAIENTVSSDF